MKSNDSPEIPEGLGGGRVGVGVGIRHPRHPFEGRSMEKGKNQTNNNKARNNVARQNASCMAHLVSPDYADRSQPSSSHARLHFMGCVIAEIERPAADCKRVQFLPRKLSDCIQNSCILTVRKQIRQKAKKQTRLKRKKETKRKKVINDQRSHSDHVIWEDGKTHKKTKENIDFT